MISVNPGDPRGIVWLASYPKSGNTWIRVFLYATYKLALGHAMAQLDLNRLVEFGENERAIVHYQRYLDKPATAASRTEIAALRPRVQADIVAATRGVILVKTHNALIEDKGFPTINQAVSAGAVYVVRNPLDVAVSYAAFRGVSIDRTIADMAEPGFATETNEDDVYFVTGSWSEHVRSWTAESHPAVLVVRYEDLLEHPAETFSAIARHVLMPHESHLLEQAMDIASFPRLREAEQRFGFPEKPPHVDRFFRVGRAGQWRAALTDSQVQRMVHDHGREMARFGYLPA